MDISFKKGSICIIGGGVSGFLSAKKALELGLEPTIFERKSTFGGVWSDQGVMWDSLRTNSSRFTCEFGEFPWFSCQERFPHWKSVQAYFQAYNQQFGLQNYYLFNTEVTSLSRTEQGFFKVCYQNLQNGAKTTQFFQFCVVATGMYSRPNMDSFQQYVNDPSNYKITFLHSSHYKNPQQFAQKNVLVVGASYSAIQIAAEISECASSTYSLFRKPPWVLKRNVYNPFFQKLVPIDTLMFSRNNAQNDQTSDPSEINKRLNTNASKLSAQNEISPALYIDPNSTETHYFVVSDEYLAQVKSGKIIPLHNKITNIQKNKVFLDKNPKIIPSQHNSQQPEGLSQSTTEPIHLINSQQPKGLSQSTTQPIDLNQQNLPTNSSFSQQNTQNETKKDNESTFSTSNNVSDKILHTQPPELQHIRPIMDLSIPVINTSLPIMDLSIPLANSLIPVENQSIDQPTSIITSQNLTDSFLPIIDTSIPVKSSQMRNNDSLYSLPNSSTPLEITPDVIIFGTGFFSDLSYLSSEMQEILEYEEKSELLPLNLYKMTIHPDLPNMAFVGVFKGLFFALAENQVNYAFKFLLGELNLNLDFVKEQLEYQLTTLRKARVKPRFPFASQPYFHDSLAEEAGNLPSVQSFQDSDKPLFDCLFYGPVLGHHYFLKSKNSQTIEKRLKQLWTELLEYSAAEEK